jgi:hypothetical protein
LSAAKKMGHYRAELFFFGRADFLF